ncbi:hypothetical protein Y695_01945 [Hydrogenophaga sp. T4]|nr:hypothetical protein Y695_01945 [Hydrogenophaga sp. T4]
MPDRCNQHQHGGDKGHEVAHGHTAAGALPQRHSNHGRQRGGGEHLCQWRHGGVGHRGLEGQAPQGNAESVKTLGLALLGTVQAHHAVGQRVFFHHIGQFVGGLLAGTREAVQTAREHTHHQNQAWKQQQHDQRELPVQVHQIAQQGQQRQAVLGQAQHGVDQHGRPRLHLVDQGVREFAGTLPGEQRHLGIVEPDKHGPPQVQQTQAGRVGQRILGQESRQTPHTKQPQQGNGHHPQIDVPLGKAPVQQGFEQSGDQGFGQGTHDGADGGQHDTALGGAEVRPELAQSLGDGSGGRRAGGFGIGQVCAAWDGGVGWLGWAQCACGHGLYRKSTTCHGCRKCFRYYLLATGKQDSQSSFQPHHPTYQECRH